MAKAKSKVTITDSAVREAVIFLEDNNKEVLEECFDWTNNSDSQARDFSIKELKKDTGFKILRKAIRIAVAASTKE